MKYFFTCTFIILVKTFIAQNFNIGYKDGFEQGFCMDKVNNTGTYLGCVAPVVTPPYPRATESINNYLDGYNRGLIDGVNKKQQNNNSKAMNSGYYIPEFKPFTPDLDFYMNIMNKKTKKLKTENNNANKTDNNSSGNKFIDWYEAYNTAENKEYRKKYIQLLEEIYNNYSNYPDKIPDGGYYTTLISRSESLEISEKCFVIVQDNKVIYTGSKSKSDPVKFDELCVKMYFPNYKFMKIESNKVLLEELGINNYTNNINKGMINFFTEYINEGKLTKSGFTIYFNEYIRDYNNCKYYLENLKKSRNNKNLNKKVSDGWQNAIMTNNLDFYEVRKVFVQNDKMIKLMGGNGDELLIDGGGEIYNSHTTVSKTFPGFKKTYYENTPIYKDTKLVYDVYFE
jgi:hypothetical protein